MRRHPKSVEGAIAARTFDRDGPVAPAAFEKPEISKNFSGGGLGAEPMLQDKILINREKCEKFRFGDQGVDMNAGDPYNAFIDGGAAIFAADAVASLSSDGC